MRYQKAAREDLTSGVARQVRTAILDGSYEAGDLLPPERELAVTFGVDRNTLRSAIQELEQLGLVERKQGSGCRVLDYRETATLDLLKYIVRKPGTDEIDQAVVRSAVDVAQVTFRGIVDLVCERADAQDFSALQDALEALDAAVGDNDSERVINTERRLVHRVIRAAHSIAAELAINSYEQVHDAAFDPTGELRLRWAEELIDRGRIDMYRDAINALASRDAHAAQRIIDLVLSTVPSVLGTSIGVATRQRARRPSPAPTAKSA